MALANFSKKITRSTLIFCVLRKNVFYTMQWKLIHLASKRKYRPALANYEQEMHFQPTCEVPFSNFFWGACPQTPLEGTKTIFLAAEILEGFWSHQNQNPSYGPVLRPPGLDKPFNLDKLYNSEGFDNRFWLQDTLTQCPKWRSVPTKL